MLNDKFSAINGEEPYSGNFIAKRLYLRKTPNNLAFCFDKRLILLINNQIPTFSQLHALNIEITEEKCFGIINDNSCFAMQLDKDSLKQNEHLFIDFRQAFNVLNTDFLKAAILASQIVYWHNRNNFCGTCGTKTIESNKSEWLKTCPECNEQFYPRISPAIIVAIENNGKLLMARHNRLPDFYAIIAGFVNPGETLEECVQREVMEETGIEIEKISYFGSQPWPFPDSLMIGYKAKYKSGHLAPDQTEITDLKWFTPDEIPEWGNRSSIARALIDDFIKNN